MSKLRSLYLEKSNFQPCSPDDKGWKVKDGKLDIVWMTQDPAHKFWNLYPARVVRSVIPRDVPAKQKGLSVQTHVAVKETSVRIVKIQEGTFIGKMTKMIILMMKICKSFEQLPHPLVVFNL